jgi:hypothetical protein
MKSHKARGSTHHAGRYGVVRYPTYYVVIDKADNNKIVHETRSQTAAHNKADKLNRDARV